MVMNESLLYVGNLPYSIEKDDLEAIFLNAGNVLSAKLPPRQSDGRSMGFGFVEMATADSANAAIEALNGNDFAGRDLRVNQAKERT